MRRLDNKKYNFAYTFIVVFFIIVVVLIIAFFKRFVNEKKESVVNNKKDELSEYTGINLENIKCTFYDYYSDSQVNSSSTPGPITDGNHPTDNTFKKFNRVLLDTKKYADPIESPAKWPLYVGMFSYGEYGYGYADKIDFVSMAFEVEDNESVDFDTKSYLAANSSIWAKSDVATTKLIDPVLDSDGDITQSNKETGKSCKLPFFDKTYLRTTKFRNSELPLGEVKENVNFPLVKSEINGVEYLSFNCLEDTVKFNSANNLEYQGKNKNSVTDADGENAFLPYNSPDEGNSEKINFGFGMKMELDFYMTDIGKNLGQDLKFEFKGDDDLWVFIDGILVLDIGGIHSATRGSFNLATMSSTVDCIRNNDIAFCDPEFADLEDREYSVEEMDNLGIVGKLQPEWGFLRNIETPFPQNLKDKLADTENKHKMTIFYLERGKKKSHLYISMNLPIKKISKNKKVVVTNGEVCSELKK